MSANSHCAVAKTWYDTDFVAIWSGCYSRLQAWLDALWSESFRNFHEVIKFTSTFVSLHDCCIVIIVHVSSGFGKWNEQSKMKYQEETFIHLITHHFARWESYGQLNWIKIAKVSRTGSHLNQQADDQQPDMLIYINLSASTGRQCSVFFWNLRSFVSA